MQQTTVTPLILDGLEKFSWQSISEVINSDIDKKWFLENLKKIVHDHFK